MSKELPLDYDSTVTIKGIYSEYPALLNLSLLFPSSASLRAGYPFTKYARLPGKDFVKINSLSLLQISSLSPGIHG